MNLIKERHDTIECFVRAENRNLALELRKCLGNIGNIPYILSRLVRGVSVSSWMTIMNFIFHSVQIKSILSRVEYDSFPVICQKITEKLKIPIMAEIGTSLNEIIDFDESVEENRLIVKLGVDKELDELKSIYDSLSDYLV